MCILDKLPLDGRPARAWLATCGVTLLLAGLPLVACPAGEPGEGEPAGTAPQIGRQSLLQGGLGDAGEGSGRLRQRLRFRDLEGREYHLPQAVAQGPLALVFTSTSCPLAKQYTPRLKRLAEKYGERGVTFVAVFANAEDSYAGITEYLRETQLPWAGVRDADGSLARLLGARMTPQVFVVDRNLRIAYRGAIDDNRYANRVRQNYLDDALAAMLDGRPADPAETKSLGCTIHQPELDELDKVTYSTHVGRILQDRCQTCHRAGQVAPFVLSNFQEARTWATEIRAYTQARLMPPWKPTAGFGQFRHDQSLSERELTLITRWIDEGTPEGDPRDLPPAPRPADSEWPLGPPDLILEMPEEYVVGPEGDDDYRHFVLPTKFDADRYVAAIDVRPGNPKTVHHVIAYTDTSGRARQLDAQDPGPGYSRFGGVGFEAASTLGGWAPGTTPSVLPQGTGRLLPKGADVVLQVHYYRTGVEERDRTRVGVYFSQPTSRPTARVWDGVVINTKFAIPPGDKRYQVRAEWTAPIDLYALTIAPHMHLLGREMKVEAHLPQGRIEPLIWIKQWDFNWQTTYAFQHPLLLPKGTRIKLVAYFDNSEDNPNNPQHPPQLVGWGERTTDEMCIAFVGCVAAAAYSPGDPAAQRP